MIYKTTNPNGMKLRPEHNVNNTSNGTIAYGTEKEALEIWVASADGLNVKKGDKWARLSDVPQWVAVIHLGVVYGELKDVSAPPPAPVPTFPDSFTLTAPDGSKAEYKFVKVL